MHTERQFEAKLSIGDFGYFVREGRSEGAKSAIYFGPTRCSDGVHRHITAVFDIESQNIDNIHLTGEKGKDRWKRWSRRPNQIRSDVSKWIRDNSQSVDAPSMKRMDRDYYCVSAWRIHVGFRLLEGFASAVFRLISKPLAATGVMQLVVKEDEEREHIRAFGRIDTNRLVHLLRTFRPFKGVMEAILPTVVRKVMPRLAKLSLIRVSRMSVGDACLLIPKREGMPPAVMVKLEQYRQLDASRVFEEARSLYEEMELAEFIPDSAKLASSTSVPFTFETKGGWEE